MNSTRWLERLGRPWVTIAAVILGVAFFGFEAYHGILRTDNDFLWHREFGRDFLYRMEERACHYLPARAMLDSFTATWPYRLDRAFYFFLAVTTVVASFGLWHRLAGMRSPRMSWLPAAATILVTAPYLHRDLSECGLQLLLLFMLSAAVYALYRGRAFWAGFWVASAIAYKVTPLLFLPFLVWKRQWRAAAWTVVCLAGWCAAPAAFLGWHENLELHRRWFDFTRGLSSLEDPLENGVEPPNHRNQSLLFALARFVRTCPPDHPLYLRHPGFAQFGDLPPATAKRVVHVTLLAFAAVLAWRWRRAVDGGETAGGDERWRERVNAQRGMYRLAPEWASVMVLTAILSPMCWLQHLVLVLPAIYLWMSKLFDGISPPRWHLVTAGLIALVLLFVHKDLFGETLFLVLMSYKLHTWAAVGIVALVLTLPAAYEAQRCSSIASAMRSSTSWRGAASS